MNKIFENRILAREVCLILTGILVAIASVCNAQTNNGIILDASKDAIEGLNFEPDKVFKKVILNLDLKETKKEINLFTAICGESTIPEIRVASLPEQNGMFASSSERTNQLRKFLAKAKSDIDYLATVPRNQQQTNLYRTLVSMVKEFDNGTESSLVIIGDLIEVSSIFNAKRYSGRPSKLMEDYDAIVAAFESDTKLPDLSGLTILLITPGKSDLHLWMSRWWVKYLTSKNAHVEVRAAF